MTHSNFPAEASPPGTVVCESTRPVSSREKSNMEAAAEDLTPGVANVPTPEGSALNLLRAGIAKSDLEDVNKLLKSTIERLVSGPLLEITNTHLATGGKQIRARLVLTLGRMLNVDRSALTYLAAALEALHNATLIHDDLQDGDTERRGNPTTWIQWGMNQAITAGDMLLMVPTTLICSAPLQSEVRSSIADAVATRSIDTACGQSLEATLATADGFTWEAYSAASVGKTGAFFALPIEVTCLAAGVACADARAIGDAALPLGLLYQLQDDVRDLYAAKGRDRQGNDLREGSPPRATAA